MHDTRNQRLLSKAAKPTIQATPQQGPFWHEWKLGPRPQRQASPISFARKVAKEKLFSLPNLCAIAGDRAAGDFPESMRCSWVQQRSSRVMFCYPRGLFRVSVVSSVCVSLPLRPSAGRMPVACALLPFRPTQVRHAMLPYEGQVAI